MHPRVTKGIVDCSHLFLPEHSRTQPTIDHTCTESSVQHRGAQCRRHPTRPSALVSGAGRIRQGVKLRSVLGKGDAL